MKPLVKAYPYLLYLLIGVSCIILPVAIVIIIMAIVQGRDVSVGPVKIGARSSSLSSSSAEGLILSQLKSWTS